MSANSPLGDEGANPVRSGSPAFGAPDMLQSQVRAARGLIGCSAGELAERAGMRREDLLLFENHGWLPPAPDRLRIAAVISACGVMMVPIDHVRGRGVRYGAEPERPAADQVLARQVRAARGLLWWDLKTLAARAGISPEGLSRFEGGLQGLNDAQLGRLRGALRSGGVSLIPSDAVFGPGVRLIATRPAELLISAPVPAGRPWE